MSRGCHSALSPPSRGRPECGCTVCSASDRRIVICATDNADYDIGKFIAEDGVAKVPRWGWEKTVKSFAFLRIGRPAKDGEEADETKECIICLSRPRTHVVTPCGHMLYCEDCVQSCLERGCAACRRRVESACRVFG